MIFSAEGYQAGGVEARQGHELKVGTERIWGAGAVAHGDAGLMEGLLHGAEGEQKGAVKRMGFPTCSIQKIYRSKLTVMGIAFPWESTACSFLQLWLRQ